MQTKIFIAGGTAVVAATLAAAIVLRPLEDGEDVATAPEAPLAPAVAPETPDNTEVTAQVSPSSSAPSVAEPSVAEPSGAEPSVAEPSVAEPSIAEPTVAEPAIAEPNVAEPSVAEPSVAEPSEAETDEVALAAIEDTEVPTTNVAAAEPDAANAPEAEIDITQTPPEVAVVAIAPRVTERRFEPDGGYVIAGTAMPGRDVAIMIDGQEVERTQADAQGAFLVIGFLGRSDTPRVMTLMGDPEGAAMLADHRFIFDANPAPVDVAPEQTDVASLEVANGDASEQAALIDPIDPAPLAQVSETAEPTQEVAAQRDETPAAVDEALASAETEQEPAADEVLAQTEAEAPATPAILSVSEDGVEVVQSAVPADVAPVVMSSVALDTITYDPSGDVILGGRAVSQGDTAGFVQVYVDNAPISRLSVDIEGRWRGDLPDIDTGVYTLRIDEVDATGDVVSRIETPFLREDPEDVVAVMADQVDDPDFTIATSTVQSGMTLWAIAEDRYGSGVLYVNVFEANRDRIRDPDLIYPGQVFVLPEDAPESDDN